VQTKEELEQELADVLVKIDRAEKRLRSLRRPPTDVSKGKTRISFITKKEQMAEAAEVSRELDSLRRREPEIRGKLQLHSQEPENARQVNETQALDLEDVTMNEKKVKKPKKQQKKEKDKAKGKA
jgi:ribosomal protein L34E